MRERRLRVDAPASDAALSFVLESALVGVWDYDLHSGRIVRSSAHDQIFGYPSGRDPWTISTTLDHVAPEHRERVRASLEQCQRTGTGEFDCRIIRADGSPAWISWHGRVMSDASGQPARILAIVMDVTRQAVVEETLEFERQLRDTFVSTLAHELRQPLSALLAGVEVLRLPVDPAVTTRMTTLMRRQIGQMDRVVEDVIDATRWASGKVGLRKQRLDIRQVIGDAADDLTSVIAEGGHALAVNTPPEPVWVDADPQRLLQVLSNLLRNAVKFTDSGGRIAIDVAANVADASVTLRVSDSGWGIAAEALPHVFDLFAQVYPNQSAGLGIGLSIAREIVLLHEGQIEVHSDGIGQGSQFIITLPLAGGDSLRHHLNAIEIR